MSDYGTTKTLPATGAGGFAALALIDQLWIVGAVTVGVFLTVLGVRYLWRRGKKIHQA